MPDNIDRRIFGFTSLRRLWHLVGGSVFPILALFVTRDILFILLGTAAFLLIGLEIVRFTSPLINQWIASRLRLVLKRKESFQPTGTTYLLLASVIVFLIFEKYVAIASLLFLSFGDFIAATIGQKFGRHRLFEKSLEGSLACLVTCLLIGILVSRAGDSIAIPVVLAGAVSATVIEFLPIPLDDNLTIPLASASVMTIIVLL